MTRTEYKKLIEYRVNFINQKLGTNYKATYISYYGGWDLCEYDKNLVPHNGLLGFDCRKSNAEMLNYVDGIFELLCHYDVKQK